MTLSWVERLHALVDEASAVAAKANESRLQCRSGCADCCTDGLTVFAIEAAVIEHHYAELLEAGEPRAEGACAFLDGEDRCRIYGHRPYVCRTQGLPLRWLEEEDGEVFEARDICPKNIDGGPPLEELDADACWAIGPFEQRLADRQQAEDPTRERVALRGLFARDSRRRLPIIDR